ncbi:MAG: substrate-binding domain-containing protein [Phycisphaeraceae bacterium]|nr:substrate-binding domain-containing protein [Phycisphaeraceae bacterium]
MSQSLATNLPLATNKSERNARLIADLINEMSWLLSQPPTCVGAKVRPEEEFANELGLTRRQVREAITFFTDKGVLIRRQGSGTYVRRVHSHRADATESRTFGLTHELLFLDLQSNNLKSLPQHKSISQSLRIGLWTDWQLSPPHSTTYVVLMTFMRHAQLAGHTMTLHSQVVSSEVAISTEAMAQQLRHASDDGFLVGSQYADTFLAARKLAGSNCSYLFHNMGSGDFNLHPTIHIDTANTCESGLMKLVELGHQRIGTIAMRKSQACDIEHRIHKAVMQQADLCDQYCVYSSDMGVASSMQATRDLLAKANGKIDAIYVANDMVLVGVAEALALEGLTPGKDIAIITLSNRGYHLPQSANWSVMEFDPESFASLTIRQLCHQIESPHIPPVSLGIRATWKPGNTHLCKTQQ